MLRPFFYILVLSLCSPAYAQDRNGVLTMMGTGHVAAEPDILTARGFINARDESAEAALTQANTRVAALSERMKPFGEVTTSPIVLRRDRAAGKRILGSDEITFLARGSIIVRLSNRNDAGKALDTLVAGGAGGAVSLEYGYSNNPELLTQARERAVADALEWAAIYARAADLSLGPVIDLRETSTQQRTALGGAPDRGERSYYSGKGASAPSIPAGVTAQITMTWALE